MGAGGSKVQVYVRADKPFYYAGDVVTGSVVLHVAERTTFKQCSIKVTGVEKVAWQEQHGSGKSRHTEHYKGKHHIFQNKLPLLGEGTLHPGDYQWPFSFQLPSNIPGSFSYQDGHTKASIEYRIKADCDQTGMLKPDFKKTIKIEVLQPYKAAPAPIDVTAEEPISYWCCFNKGVIGLKVTGETDGYMPGEQIRLRAMVDNKSTESIPCVEFRLHQKMHLKAKSSWGSDHHRHFTVQRLYQKQTSTGGPDGAAAAAGTLTQYDVALPLQQQLEATSNSQLIQSYYELEVRAKTGCCLSEVHVKHPIMINDPPPVNMPPMMQPPQDWAPQIYPTLDFSVPAPQGYNCGYPTTVAAANMSQQGGYGQYENKPADVAGGVPLVSVYQNGYNASQSPYMPPPSAAAGWDSQASAPAMFGTASTPDAGY